MNVNYHSKSYSYKVFLRKNWWKKAGTLWLQPFSVWLGSRLQIRYVPAPPQPQKIVPVADASKNSISAEFHIMTA